MPINFVEKVYAPAYDVFARPITFSLGSGKVYVGRGVFDSQPAGVPTEDGVVYSDQRTVVYIIEQEHDPLPEQDDRISIPAADGLPALGDFIIIDTGSNGGGETTLTLQRVVEAAP